MAKFLIEAHGEKFEITAPDQETAIAAFNRATGSDQQAPSDYSQSHVGQGVYGLNEGIASAAGFPVDAMTGLINAGLMGSNMAFGTEFGTIDKPFLGSENITEMMGGVGAIKPGTDDPTKQMTRRIAQEVGAVMVPGLGFASKAAAPGKMIAKELASALGSGTGAAVAQQVAPDNPLAEMAGQVIGGFSPMGVSSMLRRKANDLVAPTLEELQGLKNQAYQAADQAGVAYTPKAYSLFLNDLVNTATSSPHNLSSTRHPKASSFINDLTTRHPNGLTLTELDQLRQEAYRDLVKSSDGSERHFGQLIIDKIDEFIDGANANDLSSGNASQGADLISAARDLNKRYRKTELIEEALYSADLRTEATGSGGNINNAIRQRLASLLTDPKKRRQFTVEERAAIEDVVRQGKMEGLLRLVGKLSPSGNGLMAFGGIAGTVANPALAAVPMTGLVAKAAADAGTRNKSKVLRALIARGSPPAPKAPSPGQSQVVSALLYGQAANQNQPKTIQEALFRAAAAP